MITGIYAAFLALMQSILVLEVVKVRRGKKISLGHSGDEELKRRVRGHGNFVETVPMALALMIIAELSGAPYWSINVLGVLLLAGRIMHYFALTTGKGYGKLRVYGMVATLMVYALGSLLCMWLALPLLAG